MPPKITLDQNPRIKAMLQKLGLTDIAGFELYENIILAYDSDIDIRLREVVDRVDYTFRKNLLLVHEQDGALSMLWKNEVLDFFKVGQSMATTFPDGTLDHWSIVFSRVTTEIEKEYREKSWLKDFNPN